MKQRCINHHFGYCHSKPNAEVGRITAGIDPDGRAITYKSYVWGSCTNNWQTCSQYLKASEEIQSADPVNHPG